MRIFLTHSEADVVADLLAIRLDRIVEFVNKVVRASRFRLVADHLKGAFLDIDRLPNVLVALL